jgi:hypothetical protein
MPNHMASLQMCVLQYLVFSSPPRWVLGLLKNCFSGLNILSLRTSMILSIVPLLIQEQVNPDGGLANLYVYRWTC